MPVAYMRTEAGPCRLGDGQASRDRRGSRGGQASWDRWGSRDGQASRDRQGSRDWIARRGGPLGSN